MSIQLLTIPGFTNLKENCAGFHWNKQNNWLRLTGWENYHIRRLLISLSLTFRSFRNTSSTPSTGKLASYLWAKMFLWRRLPLRLDKIDQQLCVKVNVKFCAIILLLNLRIVCLLKYFFRELNISANLICVLCVKQQSNFLFYKLWSQYFFDSMTEPLEWG